jgi:hypothetical protein
MINQQSQRAQISPAARNVVRWGIGIAITSAVVATLVGMGGFALGMWSIFSPNAASSAIESVFGGFLGGAKPQTRTVPGIANTFDPIASYEEVKSFAGPNVELISVEASQVRRDGTLDLTASYRPAPHATYRFVRPVPRPDNAPPVGAGGTRDGPWFEPITIDAYEPGQRRRVTQTGSHNRTYTYVNEGMTRQVGDPNTRTEPNNIAATPRCAFADLWAVAVKAGAPPDAVARISYDAKGYRFSIGGTKVNLTFDSACQRTK